MKKKCKDCSCLVAQKSKLNNDNLYLCKHNGFQLLKFNISDKIPYNCPLYNWNIVMDPTINQWGINE